MVLWVKVFATKADDLGSTLGPEGWKEKKKKKQVLQVVIDFHTCFLVYTTFMPHKTTNKRIINRDR